MSDEQKKLQAEELEKSIDLLIDDLFLEDESEAEEVEKSIDIAKDAEKTADAAVAKAPKGQKDEARGAGRPKQISDVPQNDLDGRRESEYDASTTENEDKEDEPEETDQSPSMDQTQEKKRMGGKPKAPASRPFKKSESGEAEEISTEEWEQFQAFKKAQAEEADKAELKKAEDLKKAEQAERTEELRKAVAAETEPLRKALEEAQAVIKAMASTPQRAKSVTSVAALEKSQAPEDGQPEAFTKSQILDAAEDLVLKGEIPDVVVSEIEMTNGIADPRMKARVEQRLRTGK